MELKTQCTQSLQASQRLFLERSGGSPVAYLLFYKQMDCFARDVVDGSKEPPGNDSRFLATALLEGLFFLLSALSAFCEVRPVQEQRCLTGLNTVMSVPISARIRIEVMHRGDQKPSGTVQFAGGNSARIQG